MHQTYESLNLFILISLFCAFSYSPQCQERVRLHNGDILPSTTVQLIVNDSVIAKQRGKIISIAKAAIDWIESDTNMLQFRTDGTVCNIPKVGVRDESFRCEKSAPIQVSKLELIKPRDKSSLILVE